MDKLSARRVTGRRVLTSDEGLAILKEKEDKKQKEAEEKLRRKQEREERKKEKELQAKEKAEKRRQKAAEKQVSAPKRASNRKPPVRHKKHKALLDTGTRSSAGANSSSSTTVSTSTSSDSTCCECSRSYEEDVRHGTGAEWVRCACGRWLHEECIDSIDYDSSGKEKFCSYWITLYVYVIAMN